MTAFDRDYEHSGYDRGHLAPAADMAWSETAIKESFYYSNMSPQVPGFNRGIWKKLEELVRQWAKDDQSVFIVTGPVLESNLPVIGPDKISVPRYFYKVILDYTEPVIKGIGFVIPNKKLNEPLQDFAVTIDKVEQLTNIDFFPSLPCDQEEVIESNLNLKLWKFADKDSRSNNFIEGMDKNVTSVQCRGITKEGHRCKSMTKDASGYCNYHKNQIDNN